MQLVEGKLIVTLESLRLLAAQVKLGFLIALLVVNLLDAIFFQVGPVDSFCIIVGNVSCLACLRDGEVMFVDESNELASLFISDLYVLSNHFCCVLSVGGGLFQSVENR